LNYEPIWFIGFNTMSSPVFKLTERARKLLVQYRQACRRADDALAKGLPYTARIALKAAEVARRRWEREGYGANQPHATFLYDGPISCVPQSVCFPFETKALNLDSKMLDFSGLGGDAA
jgi:hypothetical protein